MDMENVQHAQDTDMQLGDASDAPATHGMAILGNHTIYLSHLGMYHSPHDRQAILEASFGSFDSTYRNDRQAHPDTRLYTFRPQKFVLTQLFSGPNGEPPHLTSFTGSIFRNHFERPPAHPEEPVEIATDVVVQVIDVVHQHKLDPEAPPRDNLTCILFGRGNERFLAHNIGRRPSYDQLLLVDVQGRSLSDDQLRHGVEVTVPSRRDEANSRIQEQEIVGAVAGLNGEEVAVEIDTQVELYFETNDFAM
jgi:hypothetical protein